MQDASAGFADVRPHTQMSVEFSDTAVQFIESQVQYPDLKDFISNVLKQDPRPAYKKQKKGEQSYGMTLYNFNICWQVNGEHNYVSHIEKI
jgi:hypothetical protein